MVKHEDLANKPQLMRMLSGIAHRGPNGQGLWIHENVGLLHKRLSIIDTSENANQPLFNESKSLVLICNGEIYNHNQLRTELIKRGHRFSCNSDSEVLLYLYEEHREKPSQMLNKLKGMFGLDSFKMDVNKRKRLILEKTGLNI